MYLLKENYSDSIKFISSKCLFIMAYVTIKKTLEKTTLSDGMNEGTNCVYLVRNVFSNRFLMLDYHYSNSCILYSAMSCDEVGANKLVWSLSSLIFEFERMRCLNLCLLSSVE